MNCICDSLVGDPNKALRIRSVVTNDMSVQIKDIHSLISITQLSAADLRRRRSTLEVSLYVRVKIGLAEAAVSACADPLKLYEYLALGLPVVSTHPFGGARAPVIVADTLDDFAQGIRTALEGIGTGVEERREYAKLHTWQRRTDQFIAALSSVGA